MAVGSHHTPAFVPHVALRTLQTHAARYGRRHGMSLRVPSRPEQWHDVWASEALKACLLDGHI